VQALDLLDELRAAVLLRNVLRVLIDAPLSVTWVRTQANHLRGALL
jgi:hypothetical protein